LIASIIILLMALGMLKLDQAKAKWRVKLEMAFEKHRASGKDTRDGRTGRSLLLILPLITVLREGLEAVIFVGGVALGQPASSIPIAAIVGIICGLFIGYIIYQFASRTTLRVFLVVMTNILLLVGAGLFSRGVGDLQSFEFNQLLGEDADDANGVGPGSFDVRGNVWHLECCSPEDNLSGQGWSIFNALLGWTNNATLGTVLSYLFYWLAVIVALGVMRWRERKAVRGMRA